MDIVGELVNGLSLEPAKVYACRVRRGRFAEEVALDICLEAGGEVDRLCFVKVFYGRGFYRRWVEVFNVMSSARAGGFSVRFYESEVEDWILDAASRWLGPGEVLYVEYVGDDETRKQLERGYPVPASRLGFKMLVRGFTWFKDWYYPEGFMEGNPKIQGVKPLNEEHRRRNLEEIRAEVESFIASVESRRPIDEVEEKAYMRAKKVLEYISQVLR